MTGSLQPPPARAELAQVPAHAVVRDYPETLAVFRELGASLPRGGGEPLCALPAGETGPLLDALVEATAWRRHARS